VEACWIASLRMREALAVAFSRLMVVMRGKNSCVE
jgi:hypothetical protein